MFASSAASGTTISAVLPDIIQTHILTSLDGSTLAAATCATTQFHSLISEHKLWHDICTSTWPSIKEPIISNFISSLPSGYRSFFSDTFPLVDYRSPVFHNSDFSSFRSEFISAIDIKLHDKLLFSKVQRIDTSKSWFKTSPFRVELLEQKDFVFTPIKLAGEHENWLYHLKENLTLSWIVIDPIKNRAMNISSRRPVSVQQHRLTGEIQVRYGTIMAGSPELVECGIVLTLGWEEAEEMQVREVSMVVEDIAGKALNGQDSLVILQGAMEIGRRKRENRGEKQRYVKYLERKEELKQCILRKVRKSDLVCMVNGVTLFLCFGWFLLLR